MSDDVNLEAMLSLCDLYFARLYFYKSVTFFKNGPHQGLLIYDTNSEATNTIVYYLVLLMNPRLPIKRRFCLI